MTSIFVALALGFILSTLIGFPKGGLEFIENLSNLSIILLLFTMGITIGASQNVMANLPNLGLQALLMASATVIGSTLAVWLVTRSLKRKRRSSDEEVKVRD